MSDGIYREILRFEKILPKEIIRSESNNLSIWSIVRLSIQNKLGGKLPSDINAARGVKKKQWFARVRSVYKTGFFKFAYVIAKSKGVQVIIRVNSFSILGENDGLILFKNKNLQDIYDLLLQNGTSCLVVVNDLDGYPLQKKLSGAIIFPAWLLFFFIRLSNDLNRAIVDRIVNVYTKNLPIDALLLRRTLLSHFANINIWNAIYNYLKPKVIYFESPHNSFEPEIVAAKRRNIKTVEIYHGVITPNEPSYFQKHLDFEGLMHGVCDEYLSPTYRQTKLLAEYNDKYNKITTIIYKSNISLSIRNKLKIAGIKNRPSIGNKKILLVTSLCDDAINDVYTYLIKNRKNLLKTYKIISIRLHPEDIKSRWSGVIRRFPFLLFSQLPLIEDIISSNTLILVNTTVALQLKMLKISYINISKEVVV